MEAKMKTLKLELKPDNTFPQFKRLGWKTEEISIREILEKKVYPYQDGIMAGTIGKKIIKLINDEKYKISELAEFRYCSDLSSRCFNYYSRKSKFLELIERIEVGIYFVEKLSFPELVEIAKKHLMDKWSHHKARAMLEKCAGNFDSIRQFLKNKNRKIKLAGYDDLDNYPLDDILSVDDFDGEDSVIVSQAFGSINFRSVNFVDEITDSQGRFKVDDEIRSFQVHANEQFETQHRTLTYNCEREGDLIWFYPEIGTIENIKRFAVSLSEKWRVDDGRYCFETDIEHLEKMVDRNYRINFPTLNSDYQTKGRSSFAKIDGVQFEDFGVGRIPTVFSNCTDLKSRLKDHGISSTGRKEVLIEKLANLSADSYAKYEPRLDKFFGNHRFIKIDALPSTKFNEFPVLCHSDVSSIREMILTMYIVKHLRGNVILESSHCNNTFDLLPLAQSLLKCEVSLDGRFLKLV